MYVMYLTFREKVVYVILKSYLEFFWFSILFGIFYLFYIKKQKL